MFKYNEFTKTWVNMSLVRNLNVVEWNENFIAVARFDSEDNIILNIGKSKEYLQDWPAWIVTVTALSITSPAVTQLSRVTAIIL